MSEMSRTDVIRSHHHCTPPPCCSTGIGTGTRGFVGPPALRKIRLVAGSVDVDPSDGSSRRCSAEQSMYSRHQPISTAVYTAWWCQPPTRQAATAGRRRPATSGQQQPTASD